MILLCAATARLHPGMRNLSRKKVSKSVDGVERRPHLVSMSVEVMVGDDTKQDQSLGLKTGGPPTRRLGGLVRPRSRPWERESRAGLLHENCVRTTFHYDRRDVRSVTTTATPCIPAVVVETVAWGRKRGFSSCQGKSRRS